MPEEKVRGSHGKLGPKWMKMTLQVPKQIGMRFRERSGDYGTGGVKVLGTVAVSVVDGMPEDIRAQMAEFVNSKTWVSPDKLKPEEVWSKIEQLVLEKHGKDRKDE